MSSKGFMAGSGFRAGGIGTRRWAFETPKCTKNGDLEESTLEIPSKHQASRAHSTQQTPPVMQHTPASPLALFSQIINPSKVTHVNGERYIRLSKIGSGGGSEIFKVIDDNGNFYALKRVQFSEEDLEVLENYQNEIDLLIELQGNDRIVNLIDSEIGSSEVLIVLELGDADLREVIAKQGTLSPNYIRYTWQQMLEAVQTIHDRKIIHGDLKPSNFLMVKGTLKLIDFGIAKVIGGDATSTEFNAQQFGVSSFRYKAPENLGTQTYGRNGKPVKLGRSADVWSLGCILYELVYGKSPFPTDMIQFRSAVMNPQYKISFPMLDDFHDFGCLVDVMQQCLQRKPSKRPSIEDLLHHQYIQQPSSIFIEDRISIEDNLRQFAHQIQNGYSDSDFESEVGRRFIRMMARDLVSGRPMIISEQRISEACGEYAY